MIQYHWRVYKQITGALPLSVGACVVFGALWPVVVQQLGRATVWYAAVGSGVPHPRPTLPPAPPPPRRKMVFFLSGNLTYSGLLVGAGASRAALLEAPATPGTGAVATAAGPPSGREALGPWVCGLW